MKKAYIKYLFALLLFGSNGITASFIHLNSYEIVLLRTGIGSLFLITVFLLSKGKITFYQHKKSFLFLCMSGAAMGMSWIFLYEAYQKIGVSLASLMYYCGPVIVMALSPVLFREKLTKTKIFSFLIVLVGIFLVNGTGTDGGQDTRGKICAVLSAFCYAAMVVCQKKEKNITGLENAMLQLFNRSPVCGD